ncbi:4401_t:CDS:2 [Racocetra fulgida]|uniref:4401_t:CDS:1 n=1 Tax=Racocetra fulgida TaxID=60492 RepID=A0A9N8VZP0_9GLOM|nr:4401_t:CDS:2 [Racocetra fulgida]
MVKLASFIENDKRRSLRPKKAKNKTLSQNSEMTPAKLQTPR